MNQFQQSHSASTNLSVLLAGTIATHISWLFNPGLSSLDSTVAARMILLDPVMERHGL
jgi:hypothetical protein